MITLFKIFFKRKLLFKKRRSLKMRALAKQKKAKSTNFFLSVFQKAIITLAIILCQKLISCHIIRWYLKIKKNNNKSNAEKNFSYAPKTLASLKCYVCYLLLFLFSIFNMFFISIRKDFFPVQGFYVILTEGLF
jgi:hypothetical protein